MILKIVQTGADVLRVKAKNLTVEEINSPKTQQMIDLMVETLRDQGGVGLAAPQIGESVSVAIVEDLEKYHEKISKELLAAQQRRAVDLTVLINPVLTIESDETASYFEGCLSVDGYVAVTPRATKVKVSYLDREGKPQEISAEGWFSRILQHEIDHMNGALYIDRFLPKTFITTKSYFNKWIAAHPDKLAAYIKQSNE